MFGRRLNVMWLKFSQVQLMVAGGVLPRAARPDLNITLNDLTRANISPMEYTFLRFLILFNSGKSLIFFTKAITPPPPSSINAYFQPLFIGFVRTEYGDAIINSIRETEQRVHAEFIDFLYDNAAPANGRSAHRGATARCLKLMSLLTRLRCYRGDELTRLFVQSKFFILHFFF